VSLTYDSLVKLSESLKAQYEPPVVVMKTCSLCHEDLEPGADDGAVWYKVQPPVMAWTPKVQNQPLLVGVCITCLT